MVYLDNAATSYPKPLAVYREVSRTMKKWGGNPGRGSHRLAVAAADKLYLLREAASEMFECAPENVVFTFNATHGLNMAIKGLAPAGCHILISDMEHNSVLRPVSALCSSGGGSFEVYRTHGGDQDKIMAELHARLRDGTGMVIACHTSNICGITLPIQRIGNLCRERGIKFVVDASQSAGHIPVSLASSGADAICMSGHKGLYGPQGTGLLLFRDGVLPSPIMEGGSGINSIDITMPELLPERLEAGTLSAPGAAALCAGLQYVRDVGVEAIHEHECGLAESLRQQLESVSGVRLYGPRQGSIVLFNIDGLTPSHVGRLLDMEEICVRSGLHCSPLAHKALGTGEDGAVRASFGLFNTALDVRRTAKAVEHIARG